MSIRGRLGVALSPLGLGLCVFLALSASAGATTLLRMSLPELVKESDRVVHARAVDRQVYFDQASRQIFTDTTFEVLDSPKGRGPGRITIKLMGGRIDPLEAIVPGTPIFQIGDEALLFTASLPDGKRHLTGLSQGAMRVRTDPQTGEKFAVSEVPVGVHFAGEAGKTDAGAPRRARALLEPLKVEIRRLAAETGPAQPLISDQPASPIRKPIERQTP